MPWRCSASPPDADASWLHDDEHAGRALAEVLDDGKEVRLGGALTQLAQDQLDRDARAPDHGLAPHHTRIDGDALVHEGIVTWSARGASDGGAAERAGAWSGGRAVGGGAAGLDRASGG